MILGTALVMVMVMVVHPIDTAGRYLEVSWRRSGSVALDATVVGCV